MDPMRGSDLSSLWDALIINPTPSHSQLTLYDTNPHYSMGGSALCLQA